ncbi:hypothetical protein [Streptomyces nondiastaticus]|uniref:SDR family oxidoreductase n=1 Tax=Streptomyces nondiastaticus TaxID=3154512 RepID=A0ABW6U3S9_9ACTN
MRPVAEPEEIAAAVAFPAGPDARYVTGVQLPVDGGLKRHERTAGRRRVTGTGPGPGTRRCNRPSGLPRPSTCRHPACREEADDSHEGSR